MIEELERAWQERAQRALAWQGGAPIDEVLEALALTVALELVGSLGSQASSLRDGLRRTGQRALLQGPGGVQLESAALDDEERAEAARLALEHGRDGLRALSGRPFDGSEDAPPPSTRDLARLLGGRLEPYEAASIARRVRASAQGRAELAWALRLRAQRTVASDDATDGGLLRLAATEAAPMRDPASGARVVVWHDETGAAVAELYAFEPGAYAAYAASPEPLRIEGAGLRTDAMQPGYWAGRFEGEGAVEGVALVGAGRYPFRVERKR